MTLTNRSGVASSRRVQNAAPMILAYIACRFAFRRARLYPTPPRPNKCPWHRAVSSSDTARASLKYPNTDPETEALCLLKPGAGAGLRTPGMGS